MPLNETDLAYMRETQADHRPTSATLSGLTRVSDGMGGWTDQLGTPAPIMIRIDGSPDAVPSEVSERITGDLTSLVKITLDLVPVTSGDHIDVDGAESYEVVSDGDPDRWATAQVVIARRL